MRYQEALTSMKNGRERHFALSGSEKFLQDYFIKYAKGFCTESFVYYPDEAVTALNTLQAADLFGSKRMVALLDFDKMKPETFVTAIKSSEDVLILTLTDKADIRTRTMTEILSTFATISCDKLKEYGEDYPTWIASFIKESGYSFSEGVDRAIYSKVGPDLFSLSNEIEKLLVIQYNNKTITMEDVLKYVSTTAKASAFEVLDDLLKKDIKSAMIKFLSYQKSSDSIIEFVKFLGNYMEKMYRILILREQKYEPDVIADIVGIPRFLVKTRYMPRALSLGKKFIASKIDRLCQLDALVRTFKADRKILLEHFIYSFSA